MFKRYFDITEFLIEPDLPISGEIADKIQKHIDVINPIREKMVMPIGISKRSGYRSVEYEKRQGRKGTSQHCFIGDGAADYTCNDIETLYKHLCHSEYTRVCLYPNDYFIHADFKTTGHGRFIDVGDGWVDKNAK